VAARDAALQSDIDRNAASLRDRSRARAPAVDWPAAEAVVEGLFAPSHQRTSLVFLASATDALLTRDLAISAMTRRCTSSPGAR
jgi:hypothetical protein